MNNGKNKSTLAYMSVMTYDNSEGVQKDLVWIQSEVKSPPFTQNARIEAGFLLRLLQQGALLGCRVQDQCLRLVKDVMN